MNDPNRMHLLTEGFGGRGTETARPMTSNRGAGRDTTYRIRDSPCCCSNNSMRGEERGRWPESREGRLGLSIMVLRPVMCDEGCAHEKATQQLARTRVAALTPWTRARMDRPNPLRRRRSCPQRSAAWLQASGYRRRVSCLRCGSACKNSHDGNGD